MLEGYWLYAVIALFIIIPLAIYAGMLLSQLKKQTANQAIAEQEKQAALKKHDTKVLNSVVIIVRAMKEEQCELSEGCWRLSVLLDSLKLSSELNTLFPSVYALYDGIKHMPILEERKKLTKPERMKLDFERMKLEADLKSKIQQDVGQLHQYATERLSVISA
ncbi:DUF2489 domain-containing protein [Pseudocolwellia sp. AS88]|uniref:DUF2489 domain-containing protein n=1 Tax=Pseudocolwellia sp. AS88 TaxID=3063958 RepID=UPI0026E937AA|nr:DUF2489 domain-containing protein [Pseudocolwellia sp. AS88]MDO7083997.1 DUF2489 domain-containing protein [Pseudocolwellia sp. AS88]